MRPREAVPEQQSEVKELPPRTHAVPMGVQQAEDAATTERFRRIIRDMDEQREKGRAIPGADV